MGEGGTELHGVEPRDGGGARRVALGSGGSLFTSNFIKSKSLRYSSAKGVLGRSDRAILSV